MLKKIALITAVAALSVQNVYGGMDEAKKWVDEEFQPSALSKSDQMKEMEWFMNAAKPFKGMEINVLSETIPTHEYESKTLTKAFEEITASALAVLEAPDWAEIFGPDALAEVPLAAIVEGQVIAGTADRRDATGTRVPLTGSSRIWTACGGVPGTGSRSYRRSCWGTPWEV